MYEARSHRTSGSPLAMECLINTAWALDSGCFGVVILDHQLKEHSEQGLSRHMYARREIFLSEKKHAVRWKVCWLRLSHATCDQIA